MGSKTRGFNREFNKNLNCERQVNISRDRVIHSVNEGRNEASKRIEKKKEKKKTNHLIQTEPWAENH